MHQLSKEIPEFLTRRKNQPKLTIPQKKKRGKKIPICNYQIRRKPNYQKRKRVREENDRGIISENKSKKETPERERVLNEIVVGGRE